MDLIHLVVAVRSGGHAPTSMSDSTTFPEKIYTRSRSELRLDQFWSWRGDLNPQPAELQINRPPAIRMEVGGPAERSTTKRRRSSAGRFQRRRVRVASGGTTRAAPRRTPRATRGWRTAGTSARSITVQASLCSRRVRAALRSRASPIRQEQPQAL